MDKSIRVIKDYELHELSLVDNPANQFANIVSIQKAEDGQNTFEGIMTKMSLENVYWSKDNSLVRLSKEEDQRSGEVLIGFVETTDEEKNDVIKNLIKSYGTMTNENVPNKNPETIKPKKKKDEDEEDMDKASNIRVGDMVSWNSSGGTARGKVTRVVRNGKIKVPNSSFTITGTPEDPAVAIRIYRDGKPTDTIVGHKMKTLRRSSSKAEGIDLSSDNSKKEGNEMAKTKQESAPVAEETKVEKTVTAEDEVVVVDEIVKSESGDAEAAAEAAAEAVETAAEVEAPAEAEAVVEAAEAPAETEVAVEDAATPTEEAEKTIEATDLEKAVETVQTSVDEVSKSVTTAVGDLVATVKSINDQIAELTKSIANVNEEIKNIKGNVEEFGKRVDSIEDDTAIRKSGDLGGVVQENKIQKRSMWGGRFLNSADLYR
jgi:hypothetical protein